MINILNIIIVLLIILYGIIIFGVLHHAKSKDKIIHTTLSTLSIQPTYPNLTHHPNITSLSPSKGLEPQIELVKKINIILKNYIYSTLCPEYNVTDLNHQCMIDLIQKNFSEEDIKDLLNVIETLRGYNENIFNLLYKIATLATNCLSYNWNNLKDNILQLDCKLNNINEIKCIQQNFEKKYSYMQFKVLIFFYSINMINISPKVIEFSELLKNK